MSGSNAVIAERGIMPPFLYRCPNAGGNIQAWMADNAEHDDLTYELNAKTCASSQSKRASMRWPICCTGSVTASFSTRTMTATVRWSLSKPARLAARASCQRDVARHIDPGERITGCP